MISNAHGQTMHDQTPIIETIVAKMPLAQLKHNRQRCFANHGITAHAAHRIPAGLIQLEKLEEPVPTQSKNPQPSVNGTTAMEQQQ
jgi:hypothetical protein